MTRLCDDCGDAAEWSWTLIFNVGSRHEVRRRTALCHQHRVRRTSVPGFLNVLCFYPMDDPDAPARGEYPDRSPTQEQAEQMMAEVRAAWPDCSCGDGGRALGVPCQLCGGTGKLHPWWPPLQPYV